MEKKDFTTTILVDQTPNQVFNAINNPRKWWSEEIEGSTTQLNDVFDYHFEDVHRCKIKLVEVINNKKVVWLVMENYFKPSIVKDRAEWIGTKISFEISKEAGKTKLQFTHLGLVPEYECYEICRDAWSQYIKQSLYSLVTTGKGEPNSTGKPKTEHEKNFTN